MSTIPIDDKLVIGPDRANIDARYKTSNNRPYASVAAAEAAINLVIGNVGLTVLVADENDPDYPKAKEYWVQPKGTTPETYGLVEKGAGVTDYNDLDNKPTISDGGQGSAQIPLSGNVKVTASTASGENAGVTVTQGQTVGEIEMSFTLPKGDTGDTGDTGEQGPAGPQGIQGKSAFVVWKETTGRTDATEAQYIEDLQTKVVRWIPVAYEALSPAPTIGDAVTFTTEPNNSIDGAIVLMPNGSPATATMMFAVSSDGQTPATYTYTYIGDMDNVDITGLLGSGDVDGTGLVNPTPSQVAKATDVMQLAAKLEGVTETEEKASVTTVDDTYISGDNGMPSGSGWVGMVAQVDVANAARVRFLGLEYPTSSTSNLGYSFGYYNSGEFVAVSFSRFDRSPNITEIGYKEYLLHVPKGATHLLTNQRVNNATPFDTDFYCYRIYGENMVESMGIDVLRDKTSHIGYEKSVVALNTNVLENKYVSGEDGLIKELSGYNTYIVELNAASKIIFTEYLIRGNATSYDLGYSFGTYADGVWTPSIYRLYDKNASATNTAAQIVEKAVDVIVSSPHFAFALPLRYAPCAYCKLIAISGAKEIGRTSTNGIIESINTDESNNFYAIVDLNLDSVAYEGKSYRQIFENHLYCDGESSFGDQGFQTYGSGTTPVRETITVDSGEYSVLFQGADSYIRTSRAKLQRNNAYYVACRVYRPDAPEGTRFVIVDETIVMLEKPGANTQFETISSVYNSTHSDRSIVYVGQGSWGSDSVTYMDSLVVVPLSMFTGTITKETLDGLYSTYVELKKDESVERHISVVPSKMLAALQPNYGFTDPECVEEFMAAMNAKAKKLGMSDSYFSNPYGGDKYGYNWVTVEDMMKMMINATSYPVLMNYASQNTIVDLPIYGVQARMEQYPATENSFLNAVEAAYIEKHGSGSSMPYMAISHKGAGWGDLNNHEPLSKVRGQVGTAFIRTNNAGIKNVAYAVFATAENYPSTDTRYRAIVDLLDICKAYYDGDTTPMNMGSYQYAMAVELPICNPECYKNNLALNIIYKTAKIVDGEEVKFHTASACKVLAAMVILDTFKDLSQMFDINHYDEDYDSTFWNPNDSGDFKGHAGDIYSLDTALYAILGWSNGVFTLSMARHAGAKMLYNRRMKDLIL